MFTGIVQKLAPVTALARESSSLRARIQTGWSDLALGESIAVNGACLTVAEILNGTEADFFLSPETLARTQLGALEEGSLVNLERSVSLQDRLSGHWVQGHIDGVATLTQTSQLGADNYELLFELPENLLPYCVEKGSITLNGVSLTINSLFSTIVSIVIVPHTWTHTNFSSLRTGQTVNVEVDVIAKYVEKLAAPYLNAQNLRGTAWPTPSN
jgi:riboflavin synthase